VAEYGQHGELLLSYNKDSREGHSLATNGLVTILLLCSSMTGASVAGTRKSDHGAAAERLTTYFTHSV
jgi:hypothetical protein